LNDRENEVLLRSLTGHFEESHICCDC
jgi:hypothetical protein